MKLMEFICAAELGHAIPKLDLTIRAWFWERNGILAGLRHQEFSQSGGEEFLVEWAIGRSYWFWTDYRVRITPKVNLPTNKPIDQLRPVPARDFMTPVAMAAMVLSRRVRRLRWASVIS